MDLGFSGVECAMYARRIAYKARCARVLISKTGFLEYLAYSILDVEKCDRTESNGAGL